MNRNLRSHETETGCERAPELHGSFRIWRRGTSDDIELMAALLPDPDRAFDSGTVLASPWQGPATDKVRLNIANHSYFCKRYNSVGAWYGVKNLFRRSRAVRSWLAAQHYAKYGVPTPLPILCLEERRFGLLGRSYLLFPFLEGDATSFLELWVHLDEAGQRSCLAALGGILGNMHRQGLLHGDLNWRNIIVVRRDGGYRFWLVDLDGSREVKNVTPALARKDLDHFLRDLGRVGADAELWALFRDRWQQQANLPMTDI